MNTNSKNILVEGTGVPARLKHFREIRQLTKTDLADRAGLNYRTIHDLETGKRDRVLEKTIMLLAGALEVSFEDIVNGEDPDPITQGAGRSRMTPALWLLFIVAGAVLGGGILLSEVSARTGGVEIDEGTLTFRDGLFRRKLWEHRWDSEIRFCEPAPWSDETRLVGLYGLYDDGGRMLAIDRRSGEIQWEVRPDFDAMKRAFGSEVIESGNFHCQEFEPADIDGDGVDEVGVYFGHSKYYPASICLVDKGGHQRGHYANCGLLYDLVSLDIDSDGKDELLVAGTNNSKAYQGATLILLDEDHFAGASIDSVTHPESSEPDSALVRLVFPQFSGNIMDQMMTLRLDGSKIRYARDDRGTLTLTMDVGEHTGGRNLVVRMDANLIPGAVSISDHFFYTIQSTWPDSLRHDKGPADTNWRMDWLSSHRRFEAGHWPPH